MHRDFDSLEKLANHLKELMINDELYLSYFRWKQRYTVELGHLDGSSVIYVAY
jgi:alpha-1,3-fucosyltransferase